MAALNLKYLMTQTMTYISRIEVTSIGLKVFLSNIDCLTSKYHEIKYTLSTEKADFYAFCKIKPKSTKAPLGDIQIQNPDIHFGYQCI